MNDALIQLSHLNLTGKVRKEASTVQGGGGFYDVYHGRLEPDGTLVAIRQLRAYLQKRDDLDKKLAREMKIWSSLSHPNILPLLGFSFDHGPYPAFISEWMTNGNALTYLNRNPEADILTLITGIASGLNYLHRKNIIHSDLKCDNVLVSEDGIPLLSDFGVSRLLVSSGVITSTKELAGSLRWMAVEFFDPQNADDFRDDNTFVTEASKETDVWAFGMTVSELLSGHVPYYHLKLEGQVLHAIMSGQHPAPSFKQADLHILDKRLWKLCTQCWKLKAYMRPTMPDILEQLSQERVSTLENELKSVKQKSNDQAALINVLLDSISALRANDIQRPVVDQRSNTLPENKLDLTGAETRKKEMLGPSRRRPSSDILINPSRSTHQIRKSVHGQPPERLSPEQIVSAFTVYKSNHVPVHRASGSSFDNSPTARQSPESIVSAFNLYRNHQHAPPTTPYRFSGRHPYSATEENADETSLSDGEETLTYWPFMEVFHSPETTKAKERRRRSEPVRVEAMISNADDGIGSAASPIRRKNNLHNVVSHLDIEE